MRRLGYTSVGDFALLDVSRAARKGVPEVVYAEGKTAEQVVAITRRFLEHDPVVLYSRVGEEQAAALAAEVDAAVEHDPRSGVVVVRRAGAQPREQRGAVGVLAAGTSDVGVASEAVAMIRAMDVLALTAFDVGVAGLHRLSGPLADMREAGVGALVVAAGMEGALPVRRLRPGGGAGHRPPDLLRLRLRSPRRGGAHGHAAELQPGARRGEHRQRHRRGRHGGAHRPRRRGMTTVPFVLRDHREQLWRRWADTMGDEVPADYREIMGSPLGERYVRAFIDDLIAWSEAEEYEAPGVLRGACERIAADAAHRLALGFTALDVAGALQALRGAVIDVLLDALVSTSSRRSRRRWSSSGRSATSSTVSSSRCSRRLRRRRPPPEARPSTGRRHGLRPSGAGGRVPAC